MKLSIAGFSSVCEKVYVAAIKDISSLEISGVYDTSSERLEIAKGLVGLRVYLDLDELLVNEKPDCILVSTPPSSHKDIIVKALERGINVISEKPLCTTLADFDEISDAARANDKIVFTLHPWKYAPAISKMIEISRGIAPIRYISWHILRKKLFNSPNSEVEGEYKKNSDGILFDYGWDVFYILKEIVQSEFSSLSPHFIFDDRKGDRVCDLRVIYKNGCIAHIHLSLDAVCEKFSFVCYGENGWFEFLDGRVSYETPSGSGVYVFDERLTFSAHPSWIYNLYLDFLEALKKPGVWEENFKEVAECIRIIELAYRMAGLR